jgi:glucose/arabinose dehydrogenase
LRQLSRRALLGACTIASLCLAGIAPRPAPAEPALPTGFQDTIVFAGLEQPTALRFAPDGRVFVAEKAGKIKVFDGLEDTEPDLFADLRTEVYDHGDRGLLGLALDPGFDAGRPYVYALYTYDHVLGDPEPPPAWGAPDTTGDYCPEPNGADDCLVSGRLTRLTAVEGENAAVEDEGGEPLELQLLEDWCQQFSSHSIGDLRFGPEGALYAGGGDGASFTGADFGQLGEPPNPCGDPPGGFGVVLEPPGAEGGSLRSQSLANLDGTIVRVDPDSGEAWPDNPLIASPDPNTRRIVAYGFRNPFRFTTDPETGELYVGNVGSSEIEEIDRFAAPPEQTFNSGWPCYEGTERQFLFEPLELDVCEGLYAAEPGSTSPPLLYYSHRQEIAQGDECPFASGSAISGLAFYEGSEYPPQYKGALFFSDSVRGCMYVMYRGEDGRPDPLTTEAFMREGQVYPGVDIEEGPDGALYYASLFGDEEYGDGAIHRVSYVPGGPTARLEASPQWGEALPLEVTLDASESSDPDEGPLEFDWDLDGDGTFETPGEAVRVEEFATAENRVVAVRVTDAEELSSVARVTLYPGDEPPQLSVVRPDAEEDSWGVGDRVDFEGYAEDAEGTPLYGLSFNWHVRLAHCPGGPESCHKHPLQTVSGLSSGSFTAPDHDYPSYLEVTANAIDKRGLSASETVTIQPRTVELEIDSDPPGIGLTAALVAGPTPFALTAIEGSEVVLSAPRSAQLEGRSYEWESWSDGGDRVHSVSADEAASYAATYSEVVAPPPEPEPPPEVSDQPPALEPPPDVVAPRTRLLRRPARRTPRRAARFRFASDERGARFRCRLDRRRYRGCRPPRVYRHLRPGRHVFRVFAIDAAGNRDRTPVVFRWRIVCRQGAARPTLRLSTDGLAAAAPRRATRRLPACARSAGRGGRGGR